MSRLALVPIQSFIQCAMNGSFTGRKAAGQEADHSPLSSAKGDLVKGEWNYNCTPPTCLHVVDKNSLLVPS